MSKEAKVIRGQLRQLVPALLEEEVCKAIYAKLHKENVERWGRIETMIKEKLSQIDNRAKDVQSYIMREVANASTPPPNDTL
jgi:Fe-S cluster biosynthesis and repair protein YggX